MTQRFISQRRIVAKIVALLVLAFTFALLCVAQNNQVVAEQFARTFSRGWIAVLGTLFGWLPFSVYELFLVVAIVGAITSIVLVVMWIVQKKAKHVFSLALSLLAFVFAFLSVYSSTASFAYQRDPLPTAMYSRQDPKSFDKQQAIDLATTVVDLLNQTYQQTEHDQDGNVVLSDLDTMYKDIANEYKRLDDSRFGGYFSSFTPRVKTIINKTIMSEMHIVGVFFAPTGEANVNPVENNYNMPHSMAHEIAHGKGVMRENEANLVASYLLLTSDKPYLRYSALMKTYRSAINLVGMYPDTKEVVSTLNATVCRGVYTELLNYSKLWSQYTLVGDIGDWFNDLYLKFNNQTGSDSYYKPPVSEDSGETDNDGRPIEIIISFSDTQNLLVKMYKEGLLQ